MNTVLIIVGVVLLLICLVLLIILLSRKPADHASFLREELRSVRQESAASGSNLRQEVVTQFDTLNRISTENLSRIAENTAANLESMRSTLDRRLEGMRAENEKSMEQIRKTVDKELSETLAAGLDNSFKSVSTQLEQVFRSMGEMKTMASDITSLRNVLTNVKNRGTWGEVQLGAILEDILAPSQYEAQFAVTQGRERVDFAIKLPGQEGDSVYLPIDAKFPMDRYQTLLDAEKNGDTAAISSAKTILLRTVTEQAKDIQKKYVAPPATTDYAILFVPSEGMYAALAAEDLAFSLQRDYKILLAGPSTLAALLNSIQIGFRTIAIEKRATEIMALLGAIKSSFGVFQKNLEATQKSLSAATKNLDRASGSSRRIIQRLQKVEEIDAGEAPVLLEDPLLFIEEAFEEEIEE